MSKTIHFCLDVVQNGYILKTNRPGQIPGPIQAIVSQMQGLVSPFDPSEEWKKDLPPNVTTGPKELENEINVFKNLTEVFQAITAQIKDKPEESSK